MRLTLVTVSVRNDIAVTPALGFEVKILIAGLGSTEVPIGLRPTLSGQRGLPYLHVRQCRHSKPFGTRKNRFRTHLQSLKHGSVDLPNTKKAGRIGQLLCAPLGIRTLDPLIKSQLLYQLS